MSVSDIHIRPLTVKTFYPKVSVRTFLRKNLAGELIIGAAIDGDLLGNTRGGFLGGSQNCSRITTDLLDRHGGWQTTFVNPLGQVVREIAVRDHVDRK